MPPHPTPPSLTSLLNQGLSLADAKNSKEKCAKCSAALHSNTGPVRCSVCSKGFHQKCSTGPKASTRDNLWKCGKCTNIQQNRMSESKNCVLPGSTNSLPSQPVPTTSRNKLKIYQWNADDIRPKLLELHDRPLNSDIDVLAFRNQNYKKLIKFHLLKVTLQSEKIETTSLEAVFYSSSKRTLCSRSYTLSKKLAWRSYPFASRLLNHLGLISTTSIYQIPQLNIICSTLP